jgi:hypothetical protein
MHALAPRAGAPVRRRLIGLPLIEDLNKRFDLRRAIASNDFVRTEAGILLRNIESPTRKGEGLALNAHGHFESWLNRKDHQVHANLIPSAALDFILGLIAKNTSPIATWYIAPFAGNVTPGAGWTGANFAANSTEYEDYDEATRVEWEEGAVASGSVDNSAAKADFTISAGVVNDNLYGAGLLQSSAKGHTGANTLLAASLFSSVRVVNATDILSIQYTLSLTSA